MRKPGSLNVFEGGIIGLPVGGLGLYVIESAGGLKAQIDISGLFIFGCVLLGVGIYFLASIVLKSATAGGIAVFISGGLILTQGLDDFLQLLWWVVRWLFFKIMP